MILRKLIFVLLMTFWIARNSAWAQPTAAPYTDSPQNPGTPAAKWALEIIELINQHDSEKAKQFVTERFHPSFRDAMPMEEHVQEFSRAFLGNNGLDFHSFRSYDPPKPDTQAVAIVRSRLTQSWQGIVVDVEGEPPHRIVGMQFAPARPPSNLPELGKLSEADLVSELEAFVERLAKADAFSGTVLLAKDGKVIWQGAFGLASRRFDIPNRIDTKFNLGSMNKMFTAVAIAQLAEQGKISYDDPISKYLSTDWLEREASEKITIEHLLTHTSGLGSYFNDTFWNSSRERFRAVDDYKPLVSHDKPEFPPGTRWRYSNTGFLLLGAIIESVSGETYFDYMRKHIYVPAGMAHTDCYAMDEPIPNLAIGYSRDTGPDGKVRWTNNIFRHVIQGGPAGGGFSTVGDLLKFDTAMRSHKLLRVDSAEKLWTPKPNSPDYGYGFGIRFHGPGNRSVGHSGGFPGISADLRMYLSSGYTVAVLSNQDRGAQIVSEKMDELLSRLGSP